MLEIIAFDLDGVLTESKSVMDKEMAELVSELLKEYCVAVITGGDIGQMRTQFVDQLDSNVVLDKLILFPTNATKMYKFTPSIQQVYSDDLLPELKQEIIKALKVASKGLKIPWGESYGDIIEDRGGQITFSALGQKAPLQIKRQWDSDQSKRKLMSLRLLELLAAYDLTIGIGGMTSIDITAKDRDKAYAIKKLMGLGFDISSMVFIGDALFKGGNDYPVIGTGVRCVEVKDVTETKQAVRHILGGGV